MRSFFNLDHNRFSAKLKVCIETESRIPLITKDWRALVKSTLAVIPFHTMARRMGGEREYIAKQGDSTLLHFADV